MPKEKWLINPAELDEFQRDIRGLGLDESYVVKGCAGSGKTLLALYRVNDIKIEALALDENALPSFTMVVYTIALREFILSGIIELGIPIKQIVHYEKWDGGEVDYIVVDEAQDFTKEQLDIMDSAKIKSIMFYGDSQQQLYSNALSVEGIANYLRLEQKELKKNYRLPKNIASFASHLCDDKDLEKKCIKTGLEKPRINFFSSWKKELDYIITEIKNRNYTDVAILLPFNSKDKAPFNNFHRNIESVHDYFNSVGFRHEFKMNEENTTNFDLDFDSDNPKLITFHSSKGLQFETVFIPFCDYPQHDKWFVERYKNPFYVAVTRTYRNIYLTHSERLSPFLNGIPSSKYD